MKRLRRINVKLVNIWLSSPDDDLEVLNPLKKKSKDTQAAHFILSMKLSIANRTERKLNHSGGGSAELAIAVLNGITC